MLWNLSNKSKYAKILTKNRTEQMILKDKISIYDNFVTVALF